MELFEMYESLGVSREVWAHGEQVLEGLKERFAAIDQTAEYNQAKVLRAMHENRVDATCFAATTGYGYDDIGRDKLDEITLAKKLRQGSRPCPPADHLRNARADRRAEREPAAGRRAAESRRRAV